MQFVARTSLICLISLAASFSAVAQHPWHRHIIDDSFRGADGVRLADFDGDGLQDIVTGWEESGTVRLYLHPGHELVRKPWPAVTVGKAGSPEDAVPFDVDGDGNLDVVSSHEGKTRKLLVHWNADGNLPDKLLSESNWSSTGFDSLDGQMWMFAEPIELRDGHRGLVVGSKGKGGSITLLVAPESDSRNLSKWKSKRIRDAGWIMTLKSLDMDADGDQDLVFSDRKGNNRGVGWLEQPNDSTDADWNEHVVGATDVEPMFIDVSVDEILVATRGDGLIEFRRSNDSSWQATKTQNPAGLTLGKAVRRISGDVIVLTSNTAADKKTDAELPGIWRRDANGQWHVIDPTTEVKLDRIECIDIDGDGDLDVLTCEERRNLGVVWYENPTKNR